MTNQTNWNDAFTISRESYNCSEPTCLDYYQLFISQTDIEKVVFEEKLVLVDESGQTLDEVTVAVEEAEDDSLMVYQYSRDESRLLRIQSRVYRNLETAWEVRRTRQQDQTRMLRVSDCGHEYRVFMLCVAGKQGWRDKVDYAKSPSDLLFLEGSNTLILRKLAVSRLFGTFKGQAIDREGQLCECQYHVKEGVNCDVIIRRVVGEEDIMTTLLTQDGRILRHQWSSSAWSLVTKTPKKKIERVNVSSLAEVEVASQHEAKADKYAYFTKKEELFLLMTMYLRDQPDVQDMVTDFLKNLLFDKPYDVIEFADQFFSEFIGIERLVDGSNLSLMGRTSYPNNHKVEN